MASFPSWLISNDGIDVKKYFGDADIELYEDLKRLVETFSKLLDEKTYYVPTGFTPHDFSHHIRQVYEMAWKLTSELRNNNYFGKEDYFCFLVAILLHDLDMAYNPYGRNIHGLSGAEIVDLRFGQQITQYFKGATDRISEVISQNATIPDENAEVVNSIKMALEEALTSLFIKKKEHREKISWIIYGHSDIKTDQGKKISTLDINIIRKLKEPKQKIWELAAFLRLADELDITYRRIDGITKGPINQSSKEHWDRLLMIKDVVIERNTIEIFPDPIEVKKFDENYVGEQIYIIADKIEDELQTIMHIFQHFGTAFPNKEIKINFNDMPQIELAYYRKKKEHEIGYARPAAIDIEAFKESMTEVIDSKGLLLSRVHYALHPATSADDGVRVHDWLDCGELLADHELRKKIVKVFYNHLCNDSFSSSGEGKYDREMLLLGIADDGVALASGLGFLLELAFSYIIPEDRQDADLNWNDDEIKKMFVGFKKVVILIGVSATGRTVESLCKKIIDILPHIQILKVLGLVNRQNGTDIVSKLKDINIPCEFLLTKYPIVLCPYKYSACPHGHNCERQLIR